MGSMLATGTLPLDQPPGHIDFTPLVTVLLTLLAVRLVFGIRLRWPVVVSVAVGGTVLGWSIEAWGVALPTTVAFATGALASSLLHRHARRGGEPA